MDIFLNFILILFITFGVVLVLFVGFGIYVSGKSYEECDKINEKINKYFEMFWK